MGAFFPYLQVRQELLEGLRHAVEFRHTSMVDEGPHLVLLQSVAGEDLEQVLLVVVRDVPQVRGQSVELGVSLARLRLSPIASEPFLDDGGVGGVFEG